MVRILLAMRGGLLRGALRYVLSSETDIDVIAECDAVASTIDRVRDDDPDVTLLDLELLSGADGGAGGPIDATGAARKAHAELPDVKVLVLVDPRRPNFAKRIADTPPTIGFLAQSAPPQRVVEAIREIMRGERVVDADLLFAALTSKTDLTAAELRILQVAAEGLKVKEIAAQLSLSPGTVRNYLTRIIAKTGARNRIEAIHIAQQSGWI